MPRYEVANAEVLERVERMMEKFHPELKENRVTLDCLFAFPSVDDEGEPRGEALMHGGYKAQAVIKIISTKDRVAGRADAEMIIDKENFDDLTEDERDALIDHELEHLELRLDNESGLPKFDDNGRPCLKIKKHDHQFGWFDSVARRHGEAAAEVIQVTSFVVGPLIQLWLPGLEDNATLAKAIIKTAARESAADVSSIAFATKNKSVTINSDGDHERFVKAVGHELKKAGVKIIKNPLK